MILTKFSTFTGNSEIVAKGTVKDIADFVAKLADDNDYAFPSAIIESDGNRINSMQYDTLVAGITSGNINGFRIDNRNTPGSLFYTILDPEAPVKPHFTKADIINDFKGDKYDEYANKLQERFADLMKDAQCLGVYLAYFPTDCDGVHLVAIPAGIELAEKKPDNIRSIETLDLVVGLPYIDNDKVMTLCMGEGGCDRYCHLK